MHHHHYFLRAIATALDTRLKGFVLVSCFCQDKDELVMEFNNSRESLFIKASVGPSLQALSFPTVFKRSKKNSIDLFLSTLMQPVTGCTVGTNERALLLALGNSATIVFKMHGLSSNVLLYSGGQPEEVFRKQVVADQTLPLTALHRKLPWEASAFPADVSTLTRHYFTLGKPVWEYLERHGFATKSPDEKWKALDAVRQYLENAKAIYLVNSASGLRLTLFDDQPVLERFTDPLLAATTFFNKKSASQSDDLIRARVTAALKSRISQTHAYLEKSKSKLAEINEDHHYQEWADLIMAHMHTLRVGMEGFDTQTFTNPPKDIHIPLRKEWAPQKTAELYYRKAKNRQIERNRLEEGIAKKEAEAAVLDALMARAAAATTAELPGVLEEAEGPSRKKDNQQSLPYHRYRWKEFNIWVGKNAAANDVLTLKHAHKEDLWLHVRDVAGSHVVIKHQSGKPFPSDVVEHAAQLAAYFSKRRTDSLCPVAYTLKKYVRKRKGDPPGAVVAEREEVIMVVPADGTREQD